jgi:hypothetical protein
VQELSSAALALAVIASFILAVAGIRTFAGKQGSAEDRKRAVLMLAAAFVILVNVLIWAA